MAVFGYIFLTREKECLVPAAEQQRALLEYAQSIGSTLSRIYVEENCPLQRPFQERQEGEALLRRCGVGDAIITGQAEWILGSAVEGARLLGLLAASRIALHCIDLGENISVPEKRRLVVSEGSAELVKKLLSALSICENSRHGEAIRLAKQHSREQGKYLGGPVPFGWNVNGEGFLVENEAQQRIITKIAAMRTERWSFRHISDKLRDEFDIRLSHEGVRKILAGNSGRRTQDVKSAGSRKCKE
jgi:DNA invertase Pin-like site-specific DNA recombinase